jgi:hypothetical protein
MISTQQAQPLVESSTSSMDCPETCQPLAAAHANLDTFFSTREFVEIWTRLFTGSGTLLIVPVKDSGPVRALCGAQMATRFGVRYIELGPGGFFASPGWNGSLDPATLHDVIARLTTPRTARIVWNVRFDHASLAAGLEAHGFKPRRVATHVLHLDGDHARTFAGYNASKRYQVRRAVKDGVIVRDVQSHDDVFEYCRIHADMVNRNGNWNIVYPRDFFFEMLQLPCSVRMFVAEYKGKIVAGGLFYRDGSSVMYGHGSTDREFSKIYPGCAVMDRAIQWACELGANSFNFGSSNGIASLEKYKECWGARIERNWVFEWQNPQLRRIAAIKGSVARALRRFPRIPRRLTGSTSV